MEMINQDYHQTELNLKKKRFKFKNSPALHYTTVAATVVVCRDPTAELKQSVSKYAA